MIGFVGATGFTFLNLAADTNSNTAGAGKLTLHANRILDGAVGAASGRKQINAVGGNALITGQSNAAAYSLDTNTLNAAGAFAIPSQAPSTPRSSVR